MFTLGLFVAQQFTAPADLADLDFFAYPEINPTYGQEAVEAPTDGFMVSSKVKNLAGATKLMEFLGSAAAAAGTATSATEPAGRSVCGPAQAANANAIHGNTCLNRIIASHPLLRACSRR